MFDINNLEKKNAILKFMNLESVSFDELRIILNEQISEINSADDSYEFWCRVASSEKLDSDFDKFSYVRGLRYGDSMATVNGEVFEYQALNEWLSKTFTEIEYEGGEGEGEYAHIVIQHIPSERYLKLVGSYYSYDGFNWDGCEWFEVKPTQVTTTQYL